MSSYKQLSLFLLSVLTLLYVHGQDKQIKKLSKGLDDLISARFTKIAPGCVVLVAKKGEIIYEKAFGVANLELKVPMQPDMIFRIGSITKQYTAIAILRLVEQGIISLQDSLQKYIRDFPYKGYTITIEHLLTHTSGIKDYQAIPNPIPFTDRRDYTPRQGVDYFKNEPLEFKPGSQFKYSNSNYYLLGYILEAVTGKSYPKYIQDSLFNKFGLTSTMYNQQEKIIPGRVTGYTKINSILENPDFVSMTVPYAAGALLSNAEDLFKWHQALADEKLVKKETLQKAYTSFKLSDGNVSSYGYGWYLKAIDNSRTVEHAGAIDGFRVDEIYLPDEDIFVTALFNSLEYNEEWMILTNDIARIALGKGLQSEISVEEATLKQYAGAYEINADNGNHILTVTLENGRLYIVSSNPRDKLPKVKLYAESKNMFYMKEAPLKFEFVMDNNTYKMINYLKRKKDAELKKIR